MEVNHSGFPAIPENLSITHNHFQTRIKLLRLTV